MYDNSHKMTVGEIAGTSYPKKKMKKKMKMKMKKSNHMKVAGIRRPVKKGKSDHVPPKKKQGY